MNICLIGANYVGLVTAGCFAEYGYRIDIVDRDSKKIEDLKKNIPPMYEPGLESLLSSAHENGQIKYYESLSEIQNFLPDIIIIAIDPIYNDLGDVDLSDVLDGIESICNSIVRDHYTVIMIRSTMPVGTARTIKKRIKFLRPDLIIGEHYDIVVVPGFLREGSAIHDFVMGYRIVIGLDDDAKKAKKYMLELHDPLIKNDIPVIFCSVETAELIKEAANSFLAIKIAFINEFADVCERTGADINTLVLGLGLDPRIGNKCMNIGPGFGGYALNRDTRIIAKLANTLGVDLSLVQASIKSNEDRKISMVRKIINISQDIGGIKDKNICFLGATFKPETSEIRFSIAMFIIEKLLNQGANIYLYDPIYSSEYGKIHNIFENRKNVNIVNNPYDAANQSDMIIIATEWNEFREIDFDKMKELMNKFPNKKPIIIDLRNLFPAENMKDFEYISVGRPRVLG